MNSAFLEYLITGDQPSVKDSVFFEATFYEKIPPLSGIFSFSKSIQFKEVTFSAGKDALTLLHEKKPEADFKWDNIIGTSISSVPANIYPNLSPPTNEIHILKIHFFGKRDETKSTKREEYDLEFYAYEYNIASLWRNFILQMANNPKFSPTNYKDLRDVPPFKRLLLVFINPNSGRKKGLKAWATAKQFLQKCGCTFIEVVTKAGGHAKDYLLQSNISELKEIDGIVTVSGDGLPHEVINGIFSRPDWEQIKDIPLGALPGGSANALAKNQLVRSKEDCNLSSACYLVAKGKTIKSDLIAIEGLEERKVYCFLSFVFGNMSRIDIESEKFRFLGNLRFYLYGVYTIARLQTDRARFIYSKNQTKLPPLDEEITGEGWNEINDSFSYFMLQNIAYIDEVSQSAPLAEFDDGYSHLLYINGDRNKRMHMVNILLKLEGNLFEEGRPAPSTGLNFEVIKSFRCELLGPGYYSIDGERYKAQKVQGCVEKKMLTIYATK